MTNEYTETEKPVAYTYYLTGPQGARFELYPVKDDHTEEDVKLAKTWLYRNQDVVSIQVRWVNPNDDRPNPEKIPDFIMLKQLKIQIGELESYILELEQKLKTREMDETRQLKKEIQSEKTYKQLKKQLDKKEQEAVSLRKEISQLVMRLNTNHNNDR
jgi:hypothetical protein